MRFIFVILGLGLFLVGTAQQVIGPVKSLNIGFLRKEKLEGPKGKPAPVLTGHYPLNLLVFLSPECPLCINYTKTLNEFSKRYAGKANIIGIIPGRSYSIAEVDSFSREYRLPFSVYIDKEKKISRLVKASVTPEVVLFDADGKIIYRGAIDDWAFAPGQKRVKATKAYLADAVEAYLSGGVVSVKTTKPVGCLINDY